jgi:hypothetical protein
MRLPFERNQPVFARVFAVSGPTRLGPLVVASYVGTESISQVVATALTPTTRHEKGHNLPPILFTITSACDNGLFRNLGLDHRGATHAFYVGCTVPETTSRCTLKTYIG